MIWVLFYITLSLLAVSLWMNVGLWRTNKKFEDQIVDLVLEKSTDKEIAENNFRRGWNEGRFASELEHLKSGSLKGAE